MLTAQPPYFHLSNHSSEEIANYIREGNLPNFPSQLSEQCLEFLEKTLQVDPNKRSSVNQLLKLKFITDPESIDLNSEQYSPNQVRSGIFQSQSSMGYTQNDIQLKQCYKSSKNGYFNEDPPPFIKEGTQYFQREKNTTLHENFNEENFIDLHGLSKIQQDQIIQKNEKTPLSMYMSKAKSNQNGEDSSKFRDKVLSKDQITFDTQMKKLFKNSNINYDEARDEYQQQLISQLKEFEDKQLQDLQESRQNEIKIQEQKDVEDEILQLIKNKKKNRNKDNNNGQNTPQQYQANKSSSTFDTSINQPQIRYQVVFNNPKDNFTLLQQDETIQNNEILLKKQYNDIQNPVENQNDSSPQTNKSTQQVITPSNFHQDYVSSQNQDINLQQQKFGEVIQDQNEQIDHEQLQQKQQDHKQKSKYEQEKQIITEEDYIQNNTFSENQLSPQLSKKEIQISNQKIQLQPVDSTENTRLILLQPDPISMTSLYGVDKLQGSVDDLKLYNFNVDYNKNNNIIQQNQKNKTDQIIYRNNGEALFFQEIKQDNNGKQQKNQNENISINSFIIDEQNEKIQNNQQNNNNNNNNSINNNKNNNNHNNKSANQLINSQNKLNSNDNDNNNNLTIENYF